MITRALAEPDAAGYLTHIPYHGLCLTDARGRHAEFPVRCHRILRRMLVRNGSTADKACREAARSESQVSRKAMDRICRWMGHPRQGVCGEIAQEDGCLCRERTVSAPLRNPGFLIP